jgi:hypothetical protein
MSANARAVRSRQGLLALIVVALLIVFVSTLVGGRHQGVQCAPFELQAVAEAPPPAAALLAPAPAEGLSPAGAGAGAATGAKPSTEKLRVSGRVTDRALSTPVPFVTVEMRLGKETDRVQTDLGGRFTSTQAFGAGELALEVFDNEVSYGVTKLDRAPGALGAAALLTIAIGPTVLLKSIGERRVAADDDWLLRIVQTPRPAWSAGEIDVRNQELAIAVGPDVVWSEVPLRSAGDTCFARWARVESEYMPEYRTRVEVRSMRRHERGRGELSAPIGLQTLHDVETLRLLFLSGSIEVPEIAPSVPSRVLVRPERDPTRRLPDGVPDFREVDVTRGRFEVEVLGGLRYSVLAWCARGEPTVLGRSISGAGGHQLDRNRIAPLLYPSFDPGVVPPEIQRAVRAGHQLVRARTAGNGGYGTATVDMWDTFDEARADALFESRYEVEALGVDCEPATLGRRWEQILPGRLIPDRLPSDIVVRPHRIEWIDPRFENARADAYVTGAPGGAIVTRKDTTLARTWLVDAKCPLHFMVWKDGCAPVSVRSSDFVARGDEDVASVQLETGWGITLVFVSADAHASSKDFRGWTPKADGKTPQRSPTSVYDYLSYPPLSGVKVKSPLVRGESDINGWVLLRGPTWPDRLSLEAPGYRLRELRELPGAGACWIAYMQHDRYDP